MKTVRQIIDETIKLEGDNSNHIDDSGGRTKYGITESVARENGYQGSMEKLPKLTAKMIYLKSYWLKPQLNRIAELSEPVATKLFDCGVNMGTAMAIKFLQRSLNAMTKLTIEVDGLVGPQTLTALHMYLEQRKDQDGHLVLVKAISSLQGTRYIELTEKWPKNKSFIFGWLRNRA